MEEKTLPRWSGTLAAYFLKKEALTKNEIQKDDSLFCKEVVDSLAIDKNNDILTLGNIEGIEEKTESDECFIELNDEASDDGEFKNAYLRIFKELKKGDIKGIITNPSSARLGNKVVENYLTFDGHVISEFREAGGNNTFLCINKSWLGHEFNEEGFNAKEDIKSDVYIKPIFVKDLETLKAKSSNIYLYGYKLILTGKNNTKFYDVVPKSNTVKYFDLCFVELTAEGRTLNHYRIRVPISKYNKNYFFPTISYWEGNKQSINIETAYNSSLKDIDVVKPKSTVTTIKNVFFREDSSNLESFRIGNLASKIVGITTNTKPEKVKRNHKWADKLSGGRTVDFLENNDLFEYTLNIKLEGGGSKVLNLIELDSIKEMLSDGASGSGSGAYLARFKGDKVEPEPIDFDLKDVGDEVGELYRLEIKNIMPENPFWLQGEKIFYNDKEREVKKKQTYSDGWEDPGLSSYGKSILQNHCKFSYYFYTDEEGYPKYGYNHGYADSTVSDDEVWKKFKKEITKNGYRLGTRYKVLLNEAPVANEELNFISPVSNNDISKALNSDLLENTCCRLIDECFEKIVRSDIPRQTNQETKAYLVSCRANKERSDILNNLKQNQWDALVVCRREGNESFIKGIANKNPKNYEEFCEAVYSLADNIKTEKKENEESWKQEIKDLFRTEKIRKEEEKETKEERKNILSIEIIAKTTRKCKVLSVMKSEEDRKTIVKSCLNDVNSYIYCIKPVTEEVELEEQKTEISENEVNWMREKDFISKWSAIPVKDDEVKEQVLINTNRYYDFYSGMTPYIEIWFRGDIKKDANNREGIDRYEWNVINSIEHPYIKSLSVEDKGVKQVSLSLFDKDFASYQKGILGGFEDGSKASKVYSLEDLIRQALAAENVSENKETAPKPYTYIKEKEDLRSDFLKFNDAQTKLTPANLRIRFGYCDANPRIAKSNDDKIKNYYKSKGISVDENQGRTHRWWSVRDELLESNKTISIGVKVDSGSRKVERGKTILQNASAAQKATDNDTNVSDTSRERSRDETAVVTYLRDYMLVGYSSTLKPNGIEYNLKGVEVCHAEIMRKRFLQRYTEIASNPIEVLYILMRIFNEAKDGEENPTGVKLVYYNDKKDVPAVDTINMMLDFSSLSESEKSSFADVDDYYTARSFNKISINPKLLKSINLSLGSEEAIKNYGENLTRPLYKNVEALINEFCAACPSRREKVKDDDVKAYDDNGNEIKNDTYTSNEVLSWFIAQPKVGKDEEKTDRNIYVVLYYRKARPVEKIRLYQWGPELAGKTVVKNISIQNKNEFAILSGVNSMQTKNGKLIRTIKYNNKGKKYADAPVPIKDPTNGAEVETKADFESGEVITTGYVSDNAFDNNRYNAAFDNCMYIGKMDILGDPSLEFNLLRQPYTYPIRLEVIVPRNEGYFRSREIRDQENKGEFGHRPTYKDSNQRLHEMTGYYVITKINHNISTNGFTTSLEISSYPRIENDILLKENGNPIPPKLLE
jgi:hypothetical protein